MIKRILLFMGSNGLGTIVDTVVLWLFSTFVFHDYTGQYIISPLISFECAVLCNYTCSFFVIWKGRIVKRNKTNFFKKYIPYNLTCTGTFFFKMALLLLFEHWFDWHVVICNLIALCFSGIINYAMGEWVIFRKKQKVEKE